MKTANINDLDLNQLSAGEIVIDCGHIPVHFHQNRNIFAPNKSHEATLDLGLLLFKKFQKTKNTFLSICLTDTSRFLQNGKDRENIKKLLANGEHEKLLPSNFIKKIKDAQVPFQNVVITLQTQNSNKFTNLIKKAKKDIKKMGTEKFYQSKNTILLKNDENFGLTCPFLFEYQDINEQLGIDWWHEEFYQISPSDLELAPLARLKKMLSINLYNKEKGILCPATYGGLLLNWANKKTDHIAIYSREDDEFITEKIARGIISTMLLEESHDHKHLVIILNEDTVESFRLSTKDVINKENF